MSDQAEGHTQASADLLLVEAMRLYVRRLGPADCHALANSLAKSNADSRGLDFGLNPRIKDLYHECRGSR